FQGTTQMRATYEMEIMGQKFSQIIVVNGDQGWIKINNDVKEMDKEMLAEQKEQLFLQFTCYLMPLGLKSKQFELSPLGESDIDKRKALGIRAASKGHRDINLYFDKETSRLLKAEYRVKDILGLQGGKEVTQEVIPSDYKEVDGIKQPMKVVINWDG